MGRYSKKKKDPSKTIENALLKISILGMLSLVFIQFFLSNNSMRALINNSSSKDVIAIEESDIYNPKGWVEIEVKNSKHYKELALLKNGITVEEVFYINDILTIEVYDGDVIEIDATDYKDSIEIIIRDISENINDPKKNQQYKSNKNIVYLFKTKIDFKNNG